jgi:hypothetical protein
MIPQPPSDADLENEAARLMWMDEDEIVVVPPPPIEEKDDAGTGSPHSGA